MFVYTQNTQCPLRLACDLVSWLRRMICLPFYTVFAQDHVYLLRPCVAVGSRPKSTPSRASDGVRRSWHLGKMFLADDATRLSHEHAACLSSQLMDRVMLSVEIHAATWKRDVTRLDKRHAIDHWRDARVDGTYSRAGPITNLIDF